MRTLALVFLAATSIVHSQTLADVSAKRVTFESPAHQLNTVLRLLGQKAGIQLSASPSMWQEYVYVNVSDASLGDLLERLAVLCSGEWKETSQGLVMSRSGVRALADERAEIALRLKSLQSQILRSQKSTDEPISADKVEQAIARIEELQKKMETVRNYDQNLYKESATIAKLAPGERARIRLMQCVDLGAIAALKNGERIVFSTNPTRMQRRMSPKAMDILRALSQEHAIWHEAAQRRPQRDDGEGFWLPFNDMDFRQPMKSPPAKALLTASVSRNFGSSKPNISLSVYDAKGKVILQGSGFGSYDSDDDNRFEQMRKPPESAVDETVAEFSPETNELMNVLSQFGGRGMPNVKLSNAWITRLGDPETHEPLSFVATEILHHICKAKKCNVIAAIPDSVYLPLFVMGGGKATATTLLHQLRTFNRMEVVEKDGWLTARPEFPAQTRLTRSDRVLSKKILSKIVSGGRLSLEDLAMYAAVSEPPSEESTMVMSLYLLAINQPELMNSLNSLFSQSNWNALRLYGRLSDQQRKALVAGNAIPFAGMNASQKEAYFLLVYGADAHLDLEGSNVDFNSSVATLATPAEEGQIEQTFDGNDRGTLESEPTEQLPNGIPLDAFLTMTVSNQDVLFARDSSNPEHSMDYPQDINSIAWTLFSKERPDLFPPSDDQPNYDLFRTANQRNLHMKLNLTPRFGVNEQLIEFLDKGDKGVPFKDLPGAIRKKIEEAIEQHRKAYRDVKEGGASEVPPPADGSKIPPQK